MAPGRLLPVDYLGHEPWPAFRSAFVRSTKQTQLYALCYRSRRLSRPQLPSSPDVQKTLKRRGLEVTDISGQDLTSLLRALPIQFCGTLRPFSEHHQECDISWRFGRKVGTCHYKYRKSKFSEDNSVGMQIYFGFTVAGNRSAVMVAKKIVVILEEMRHEVLTRHLVEDNDEPETSAINISHCSSHFMSRRYTSLGVIPRSAYVWPWLRDRLPSGGNLKESSLILPARRRKQNISPHHG
jgi:hypothetical protein